MTGDSALALDWPNFVLFPLSMKLKVPLQNFLPTYPASFPVAITSETSFSLQERYLMMQSTCPEIRFNRAMEPTFKKVCRTRQDIFQSNGSPTKIIGEKA